MEEATTSQNHRLGVEMDWGSSGFLVGRRSSRQTEVASSATCMIEVEVVDSRGLFLDEACNSSSEVWVSMQVAHEKERQWCRLGSRRKTFLTASFGRDRFFFESAEDRPNLLFEAFAVSKREPSSPKLRWGRSSDRTFLGSCECAPWLERQDDADSNNNYRWIRLESKDHQLKMKKKRSASIGPCVSLKKQRVPTPVVQKARRELRVAVFSKLGATDRAAACDATNRWFYDPFPCLPRPYLKPNVLRLAILRVAETKDVFVAARVVPLSSHETSDWSRARPDDPNGSSSEKGLATTRTSKDGIFAQMLSCFLFYSKEEPRGLDIAIINVEGTVEATARLPVSSSEEPMPMWMDLSDMKVKLAYRLDYDESADDSEDRPFFDDEIYGLQVEETLSKRGARGTTTQRARREAFFQSPQKNFFEEPLSPLVVRPVNALRVVVARARGLCPSTSSKCGGCAATVYHYGGPSLAESRSTRALGVRGDGTVVWNECFDFAFDKERVTSASEEMVRLVVGGGPDFPPREVWADAPRHRVSRNWYELGAPGGPQVLVIAQRYFDDSLVKQDRRKVALEHLTLAFPDLERSAVESVYDSTSDLSDACVALGALAALDSDLNIDDVAASNATDLSWILSPLLEKKNEGEEKNDPKKKLIDLLYDDDTDSDSFDYDDNNIIAPEEKKEDVLLEAEGEDARSLVPLPTRLVRCSAMSSLMERHETAELIEAVDLSCLKIDYVFRQKQKVCALGRKGKKNDSFREEEEEDRRRHSTTGLEYHKDLRPFSPPQKMRRKLVVRIRTECATFEALPRGRLPRGRFARAASCDEASRSSRRLSSGKNQSFLLSSRRDEAFVAGLRSRWDKTPFELAKVEIDVLRTPRDFATLRAGLVAKLSAGDCRFAGADPPLEIPPLPKWVRNALRMKNKTRGVSVAAGVATVSVAGAIAIATGVAPIVAGAGAVALGAFALSGARKSAKLKAKNNLDKELQICTWLQDTQKALLNFSGHKRRRDDAILFFTHFIAQHSTSHRVYQRPAVLRQTTRISSSGEEKKPSILQEHNTDDGLPPPPPPPPIDYLTMDYSPAPPPPPAADYDIISTPMPLPKIAPPPPPAADYAILPRDMVVSATKQEPTASPRSIKTAKPTPLSVSNRPSRPPPPPPPPRPTEDKLPDSPLLLRPKGPAPPPPTTTRTSFPW